MPTCLPCNTTGPCKHDLNRVDVTKPKPVSQITSNLEHDMPSINIIYRLGDRDVTEAEFKAAIMADDPAEPAPAGGGEKHVCQFCGHTEGEHYSNGRCVFAECKYKCGPYMTMKPAQPSEADGVEAIITRLRKYSQSIAFEHELGKLPAAFTALLREARISELEALKGSVEYRQSGYCSVKHVIDYRLAYFAANEEVSR